MKIESNDYQNEDPFYYKYREFIVGFFVLIPIILIPVIFGAIVLRSDLVNEWFYINFKHNLSAQIIEGNEVYILSKKVGYVKDVQLNKKGFIVVKLKMDEQYRSLIGQKSKVRLKQKNMFFGDWQMELIKTPLDSTIVEDNDTLEIISPLNMQELSEQAINIVILVDEILDTIAHGDGVITHLLNSDTLINNRVEEASKSLRIMMNRLNSILLTSGNIMNTSDKLIKEINNKRVPELFDHIDTIITRSDTLISSLNNIVTASDSIPDAVMKSLKEVEKTLQESQIILKATQKHWILRKEVKEVKKEEKNKRY
jgi:hypothetical protein